MCKSAECEELITGFVLCRFSIYAVLRVSEHQRRFPQTSQDHFSTEARAALAAGIGAGLVVLLGILVTDLPTTLGTLQI